MREMGNCFGSKAKAAEPRGLFDDETLEASLFDDDEKAEGGGTMFDGDVDDVLDLSLKGESKLDKFYRWVAAQ